jgi:acetylornithine deacetylase/succinyl-diaminopimelate desuccinylase family protein
MVYSGLRKTLSDLVRINSVNPAYAGGRPEGEIQEYVKEFFISNGLDASVQPVMPGRDNIVARLKGRNGLPPIVFEAHSDTAGIEGMDTPFNPEIRDGRMYGRGTCDTKAGLAAMMWAVADLRKSGIVPKSEVWVVSAVDEEHSYQGVLKLRENLKAAAAVVAEPTEMRLVVASKGCVRARIRVFGRAAHSSKPELGVNAITQMARVLQELENECVRLATRRHLFVGSPTMSVGLIEGGTQVNMVPAACTIVFDRRLIPGEDPDAAVAEYREMLRKLQAGHSNLKIEMEEPMMKDWPLDTPVSSSIVECVSEILRVSSMESAPCGVPFGSDASKLAQVNIPSIILGPGSIDHAHAADEHVELEQVEKAFEVYRKIMLEFE